MPSQTRMPLSCCLTPPFQGKYTFFPGSVERLLRERLILLPISLRGVGGSSSCPKIYLETPTESGVSLCSYACCCLTAGFLHEAQTLLNLKKVWECLNLSELVGFLPASLAVGFPFLACSPQDATRTLNIQKAPGPLWTGLPVQYCGTYVCLQRERNQSTSTTAVGAQFPHLGFTILTY